MCGFMENVSGVISIELVTILKFILILTLIVLVILLVNRVKLLSVIEYCSKCKKDNDALIRSHAKNLAKSIYNNDLIIMNLTSLCNLYTTPSCELYSLINKEGFLLVSETNTVFEKSRTIKMTIKTKHEDYTYIKVENNHKMSMLLDIKYNEFVIMLHNEYETLKNKKFI